MKILLHICCSNCATYPFRILDDEGHEIKGFWFNPNIHPYDEYRLRLYSLKELSYRWHINILYEEYDPSLYFKMFGLNEIENMEGLKPHDNIKSPQRCAYCYNLRLRRTAEEAHKQGFDAFTTTLLISPYQDFEQIVLTGRRLADKYNIHFYFKDFRVYFTDSKSLSRELGLYRQKYCGCIFSREERRRKIKSSK